MPESRTDYEQLVLNEIRNFPESSLPKILKMLSFFRNEILDNDDQDEELFWKSFGSWKDDRSAEEIIKEIYAYRISTERDILL